MSLNEEDLKELLPSGTQTKFDNRVAWAKSYFVQAKVLDSPRRGYFRITPRGQDLLKQGHDRINVKILNQYSEFVDFHQTKAAQVAGVDNTADTLSLETPEETLQRAYVSIRGDLASEILDKIKRNSPQFFERLVVDVMVALGYGGSRSDAGKSIGQSGDEGIDGIIKEDPSDWMLFTFRLKDGMGLSAGQRSKNSLELFTEREQKRACLSRPGNFLMTP